MTTSAKTTAALKGKYAKLVDAKLLLHCALFIDVLAEAKNVNLKTQKIDSSIIDVVKAVENTKQNYWSLLKHVEKDSALIFKLSILKLIIDDGKPCYQDVKLKKFLHEKGDIVNHLVEIVKSIVECFDKHYGKTISNTSKAAVNVHGDEGDCLLFDVSRILNCNVWPDSTKISQ